MSEANKALVRRFYDELNKGNLDIIDAVTSESFVEHEEFPGVTPDRAGVRQMFQILRTAFPDLTLHADDIAADGDKVFVRARMRGTHRGEFMGIPATGRSVDVPMADFLRVENGRAVEHWGVTDTGALMQQLGQG